MDIDITSDFKDAERMVGRLFKEQVPFATSQGINDTLFQGRAALMKQIDKKLHKPTPFTAKGFQFSKATKRVLVGTIFVEGKRDDYLRYQIEGGTRRPSKKVIGVPFTKNIKLNKYGNIAGRRRGLVKGKNQFIATINDINGVWQLSGPKRNRKLKLMVAFEKEVKYTKRFPFYQIVAGVTRSRLTSNINKRLDHAIRTAK